MALTEEQDVNNQTEDAFDIGSPFEPSPLDVQKGLSANQFYDLQNIYDTKRAEEVKKITIQNAKDFRTNEPNWMRNEIYDATFSKAQAEGLDADNSAVLAYTTTLGAEIPNVSAVPLAAEDLRLSIENKDYLGMAINTFVLGSAGLGMYGVTKYLRKKPPVNTTAKVDVFGKEIELDTSVDELPFEQMTKEKIIDSNRNRINLDTGVNFNTRGITTYSFSVGALEKHFKKSKKNFTDALVDPLDIYESIKNIKQNNNTILKTVGAVDLFNFGALDFLKKARVIPNTTTPNAGFDADGLLSESLRVQSFGKEISKFNEMVKNAPYDKNLGGYRLTLSNNKTEYDSTTSTVIVENKKEYLKTLNEDMYRYFNKNLQEAGTYGPTINYEVDVFGTIKDGRAPTKNLGVGTTSALENQRAAIRKRYPLFFDNPDKHNLSTKFPSWQRQYNNGLVIKELPKNNNALIDGEIVLRHPFTLDDYFSYERMKPLLQKKTRTTISAMYDADSANIDRNIFLPIIKDKPLSQLSLAERFDYAGSISKFKYGEELEKKFNTNANRINYYMEDLKSLNESDEFKLIFLGQENNIRKRNHLHDTRTNAYTVDSYAVASDEIDARYFKEQAFLNYLSHPSIPKNIRDAFNNVYNIRKSYNINDTIRADVLDDYDSFIKQFYQSFDRGEDNFTLSIPNSFDIRYDNTGMPLNKWSTEINDKGLYNDNPSYTDFPVDRKQFYEDVQESISSPNSPIYNDFLVESLEVMDFKHPKNIDDIESIFDYLASRENLNDVHNIKKSLNNISSPDMHFGSDSIMHARFTQSGDTIVIDELQTDLFNAMVNEEILSVDSAAVLSTLTRTAPFFDNFPGSAKFSSEYIAEKLGVDANDKLAKLAAPDIKSSTKPVDNYILDDFNKILKKAEEMGSDESYNRKFAISQINKNIQDGKYKKINKNTTVGFVVEDYGKQYVDEFNNAKFTKTKSVTNASEYLDIPEEFTLNSKGKVIYKPEELERFKNDHPNFIVPSPEKVQSKMYLGKQTTPSDNKVLTKALENLDKGVEELGTVPLAGQEDALEKILGPLILEAKKRGARYIALPDLEKLSNARGKVLEEQKKGPDKVKINIQKITDNDGNNPYSVTDPVNFFTNFQRFSSDSIHNIFFPSQGKEAVSFNRTQKSLYTTNFDRVVENLVKKSGGKIKATTQKIPYVNNMMEIDFEEFALLSNAAQFNPGVTTLNDIKNDLPFLFEKGKSLGLDKIYNSSDSLDIKNKKFRNQLFKLGQRLLVEFDTKAKNFAKENIDVGAKINYREAKVLDISGILNNMNLENTRVGMKQGGLVA
tara:strand:+ start:736 stop:4695 length:3960 start_codon:yes stop_codon:yes gene_type:complete